LAKHLLSFFGSLSILAGFLIILGGLLTENGIALSISLYAGGGFLLAGAPLLGFARVIVLLEGIQRNTAFLVPPSPAPPERLTLDQMLNRARAEPLR